MTTQQNTNTYFSKPKNTRKIMKITQQIFSALALIAITANINLPINSKLPNLFDGVKASASSGNISPTVDCSGSGGAYSNLPSTPTASNYTLNTPINTNLTFNSAMFDTGFVPSQTNYTGSLCAQSLPSFGTLPAALGNYVVFGTASYTPNSGFVGTDCFNAYLSQPSSYVGTNVVQVKIQVGGWTGPCGSRQGVPYIDNNATVNSPNDPYSGNNTATALDNLCYKTNTAVVMTATTSLNGPATSTAGLSTVFTSVITNNGPSTVTTADINFQYDATKLSGITALTTSGTLGIATTTGSGASTIYNNTITGLTLASGQSITITYTATVASTYSGTITPLTTFTPTGPTSSVAGCSMVDTDPADNTDRSATTTVSTIADMSITKTSNSINKVGGVGQINQNTNVIYTLTATNNGPSTAGTPITIVDTYDSTKIEYVSSNVAGSNMTCGLPNTTTPTASTITCTSSTAVANGGTEAITITFKAL